MVAFSSLIVVTNDAVPRITVKQAVLEWVRTTDNRLGYLPDGHFGDGPIRKFRSVIKSALYLHMAHCAINNVWRQATYKVLTSRGDVPPAPTVS